MPVGRNEQVFTVLESKSRSRSLGIHLLYLNFRSLSTLVSISVHACVRVNDIWFKHTFRRCGVDSHLFSLISSQNWQFQNATEFMFSVAFCEIISRANLSFID